jgi:hypothetical protein
MRITFLIIQLFCLLLFQSLQAQEIKFEDLGILQSHPLDYDIDYLSRRGWEFNSSRSETDSLGDSFKQSTWSLNKDSYSDRAEGWLYLHMYPGYENLLVFQTSKSNYEFIKEEVKKTNFSHLNSDVSDNSIFNVYENGSYRVIFETSKSKKTDYDYSYSSDELYYTITIVNYAEFMKRIAAYEVLQAQIREQARIAEQRRLDSIALEEKKKLQKFLLERKFTVYDYSVTNPSNYAKVQTSLIERIRKEISNYNLSAEIDLDIIMIVDTLVNVTYDFNVHSSSNDELLAKIKALSKDFELQPASVNGYSVKAQAIYKVNVLVDNQVVEVRKNNVETKYLTTNGQRYSAEINSILSSSPMGKYSLSISKRAVNGKDYSTNKVISFSAIGGPTNGFRSLLVPGWGVSRVSGGQKSGLATSITVYGLIGASAILKLYSDSEYKKYHNATDQGEMDTHYQNANGANKGFLICAGAAATVWLLDVILVTTKGFKNNSEARKFKQNISFYFDPTFHSTGLAVVCKF